MHVDLPPEQVHSDETLLHFLQTIRSRRTATPYEAALPDELKAEADTVFREHGAMVFPGVVQAPHSLSSDPLSRKIPKWQVATCVPSTTARLYHRPSAGTV